MQKIFYPSDSKLTLSISDFSNGINTEKDESLTNINSATSIKNFSFSSGALENGIGFDDIISSLTSSQQNQESLRREIQAIGDIEKIFHFYIFNQDSNQREDKLIIVDSELKFYYINLYDEYKKLYYIREITFSNTPIAVRYRLNGEDVMIFSSETDNMVVWNGKDLPYEVLDAPKISSMALHYERLFATVDQEKTSVWFSDDLDPTNWSVSLDEAGFINLIDERGALLKVVSFCDYIYIFRENGISRISAYSDQTNFSVSNLFVSSGKIVASSVCVCGDKIYFLASDGIYKFDGVDTVKILDNISKNISDIENQNASSCYYNGSYYLACKYKFDNNQTSDFYNALIEIDINNNKLKNITHGVDIKYLTTIFSDVISGVFAVAKKDDGIFTITKLNNSGTFLQTPLKKEWKSPRTKLNNINNQKTLQFITLESIGDCEIVIYHDNKESKYIFKGSQFPLHKRVNIPLYNFSFKIISEDTSCKIKNLKFHFQSSNGRL